ncbi:hypothetical protein [uncultured Gimesia sp.]|uniref:hypothetical protein n=1 Tax=uncultured Gimesia sp. TaxID=1678688 RepID=UPI0026197325|nr:hypothetical protein [uncultured Gimesia sp.]
MNGWLPFSNRWRTVLQTPVAELLRGRITGPLSAVERLDTSALPESVVAAIDAVVTNFSGYRQTKITRQLINSCKIFLQEGRDEAQLVAKLSEPESISSLIHLTRKADWVLTSPVPAQLWPTVATLVMNRQVRTRAARKMFYRVSRSIQWQLEAGETPESLATKYGETISLGGLLYETHSPELLLDYRLPESVAAVVLDVIHRTRLRPAEKLDTARELCAHFADGLEKGNSPDDMIKSFGSPATSARLIRRACLRNRSFAWHAWRRTWQTTAVLSAIVFVLWTVLAVRFLSATPTVTFDIIQEVDDQSRAIPMQERAWPLYRKGLIILKNNQEIPNSPIKSHGISEGLHKGPESKYWPEAKAYLVKHADVINLFIEASSRPKLGFINRDPENSEWLKSQGHGKDYILNPPDLVGIEILLPQVEDLSGHVGSLLMAARYLAVEEGDSERYLQLVIARLSVAAHYRQSGPYTICQIGANGITGIIVQDAASLVIEQPDFFNDEQLATLFQKISATQIKAPNFRQNERILKDYVQKIYTDDGTGNGRFAADGFPILQRMNHLMNRDDKHLLLEVFSEFSENRNAKSADTPANTATQLLAAPVAAMFAERKELQAKLLFLSELLWKQRTQVTRAEVITNSEYLTEYRRLLDSPSLRLKYLPALVIMPYEQSATYWFQTPKHQAQRDAALVVIAAERFRRKYGAFPKTAEELVPSLLSEVPLDPFTDKPLKYLISEGRPMIDSFGLKIPEEK